MPNASLHLTDFLLGFVSRGNLDRVLVNVPVMGTERICQRGNLS